jgi:ATP phosphoribosyltransferase-like protein
MYVLYDLLSLKAGFLFLMGMENNVMLRIAVQTKGRLNEQSMDLLKEAGVSVSLEKRKSLMRAVDFPAAGLADAIFDIVSSGGTLVSNGLVEVEKVLFSEAVLIGNPGLFSEKMTLARQLMSRFEAVRNGIGKKYLVLNIPVAALDEAISILPAMRSPAVIPLANSDWCSLQTVIEAIDGNRERYLYEVSDLIYHLLVLNEQMGFTLADIENELASRHK